MKLSLKSLMNLFRKKSKKKLTTKQKYERLKDDIEDNAYFKITMTFAVLFLFIIAAAELGYIQRDTTYHLNFNLVEGASESYSYPGALTPEDYFEPYPPGFCINNPNSTDSNAICIINKSFVGGK